MDESGKGGTAGCRLRLAHTTDGMSLSEELPFLRRQVKEQEKEIRRLKEENEFLEEASTFFAASCRKSARRNLDKKLR